MRARGIDAHNVYDLRQQGWSDAALLQSSAANGRVFVTHNIRDFMALHHTYLAQGRFHAGIVVTPMRPIGTLLTRLMTLHETTTVEEMSNTLRFL
ncbi:MAG: hypothetical protein E8D46_00860 [Nitrospira sp.]|nr:MAG: hypothetical protein E8D46_00860 [Nitrospira sp.]